MRPAEGVHWCLTVHVVVTKHPDKGNLREKGLFWLRVPEGRSSSRWERQGCRRKGLLVTLTLKRQMVTRKWAW